MFDLRHLIFWLAAAVFIGVGGLLMAALFRFRQQRGPEFRDSLLLEIIWVMIPIGLLAVLLILTYQAV